MHRDADLRRFTPAAPACPPPGNWPVRTGHPAVRAPARLSRAAAAAAAVVLLAGCGGMSKSAGRAAAAGARGQVIPAATALYQRLFDASSRSVAVADGADIRCGSAGTRVHYGVTLRLYPFSSAKTSFSGYARQVTSVVTSAGWALRRVPHSSLPSQGPFVNPAALSSSAIVYQLTKHVAGNTLAGGLFVYPQSGADAGGSLTVNGACVDAGPAAAGLTGHPDASPLPAARGGA